MESLSTTVRVLVASNKANVASSTAKFLRNRKHEVVTCTSRSKMLELIKKQKFHVIVTEHDPKSAALKSDPVDGLELLKMEAIPPVIVALDETDNEALSTAVQGGAADIIPLPMSQQQERLAALWQHVMHCQLSSSEAGQGCLLNDDLLSFGVDPMKEEHFSLDDLELEPLADTYKASGQSDQSGMDDPLFDVSSSFLDCSTANPSTAEDNLHGMETLTTDEVVSSVISAFPSSAAERKRMWNAIDLEELLDSSSMDPPSPGKAGSSLADDLSGADSDSDERKNNKRIKVEWTSELHDRFVQAVEALGAEKAVPSRILDRMGVIATGLTRQNIASHLQKYRHRFKGRGTGDDQTVKAQATVATPLVPPYVPGVPTSAGVPVGSTAMVVPQSAQYSQAAARPQAGLPPVSSQAWMPHMQLWSPFPHGTILYNHMGQPIMPASAVPTTTFSHIAGCQTGPTSDDIQKAIRDVLSKPKAKAPLGLTLDPKKVLENLNKMPELVPSHPGTAAA